MGHIRIISSYFASRKPHYPASREKRDGTSELLVVILLSLRERLCPPSKGGVGEVKKADLNKRILTPLIPLSKGDY